MSDTQPPPTPTPPSGGRTPPRGERTPPRGEGRTNQNQRTPNQLHQGSGVPHGHVPAYLPGSASLVEELDKRVLVVLRDGKHLVGNLCSYDQYSNLVLEDSYERRILVDSESGVASYNDIPLGIYVVRGDTVVLMGRLADGEIQQMKQVDGEEFDQLAKTSKPPLEWDFDTDLIA